MRRTIIDASQLELEEKVVSIKRVTKVVKGGRNMRFTALVVVGDGNGHVGAGLGKAAEIPEAIRKGKEDAIKKLIEVKLDQNNSITHDITGKHTGASVLLKRAPEGTGVIAGGPARNVCELAGIKNIRTKSLGSNNKQNVVKGGRNMRFTALVVVGDGNGHVGAGLGKAAEIPEAIRKGKEDAIKKLIEVKLDQNNSITHDITGKHTGASVLLKRAPEGTGVIAGGPARNVCELAGIKNIRTKSLGSNNKQNVVLATINALGQLKSPEEVARLRGKSVEEILG